MSYVALDKSILTSTVLKEGPLVVAVWILLLADADRYGETRATPIALASLLRVKDDDVIRAFKVLASPDPNSRNKKHKGARIVSLGEGRWKLISYENYKRLASKAYAVERQLRHVKSKRELGELLWAREACDDWIGRHGGTAPGGRIGQALKPLVKKHGWPAVRPAWHNYLAQTEPEYVSPQRFAATYARWLSDQPRQDKKLDASREAIVAWAKKEKQRAND